VKGGVARKEKQCFYPREHSFLLCTRGKVPAVSERGKGSQTRKTRFRLGGERALNQGGEGLPHGGPRCTGKAEVGSWV